MTLRPASGDCSAQFASACVACHALCCVNFAHHIITGGPQNTTQDTQHTKNNPTARKLATIPDNPEMEGHNTPPHHHKDSKYQQKKAVYTKTVPKKQ